MSMHTTRHETIYYFSVFFQIFIYIQFTVFRDCVCGMNTEVHCRIDCFHFLSIQVLVRGSVVFTILLLSLGMTVAITRLSTCKRYRSRLA